MTNCVCSFPAPSPAQWWCFARLQTTITLLPNIRIQTVFANTAWTINTPAGGSSALSRVTLCGGGCQVAQIWSPHTGACKQCHVWSPGHWDSGTAETLPPHIFTYLHISPRLRCQCCSLTFSSFYTDQETFDPSLQSPGRHAALQHFQYNGEY